MSFVDVLPTEPVIATTRAALRPRTARPSAATRKPVIGDERRSAARTRFVDVRDAAADRDEEIARAGAARIDLDARHRCPDAVQRPSASDRSSLAWG